jgi:hypothetical protein
LANFSYQSITYTGTDITFSAPTGGALADSVNNPDTRGFYWVKNAAAGGTITVTIHTPGSVYGISLPDVAVSIPDGEQRLIGPLSLDLGDPAFLGAVAMSITGTMTGVTAAAVKVP